MRHRIDIAFTLARCGIHSKLVNGLIPGLLERALLGETVPGTEIV
jgi:isopentenyl phosphate kinase